jgi:hypothetical protein
MPADASPTQAIQPWIDLPLHRRVTCVSSSIGTFPTTRTPCSDRFVIRTGTRTLSLSRNPESKTFARADLLSSAGDFFTVVLNPVTPRDQTNEKVLINSTLTKGRGRGARAGPPRKLPRQPSGRPIPMRRMFKAIITLKPRGSAPAPPAH